MTIQQMLNFEKYFESLFVYGHHTVLVWVNCSWLESLNYQKYKCKKQNLVFLQSVDSFKNFASFAI